VEQTAITILNSGRTMSIATVRPDGWPQATIVGYANEGFDVFFLIFRSSQKFANIQADDRVAITVGEEPSDLRELKAVYAGAHAAELTDPKQRDYAWRLLMERHPNLKEFEAPEAGQTALMRATCKYVSVLDYSQGYGHTEQLTVGGGADAPPDDGHRDEWGSALMAKPDNHARPE
jgi:nitroimidazol reductase NimA-like FMN-containing flavoprotein (pyridoxamine 5'-phosphate oxidase superfamily)